MDRNHHKTAVKQAIEQSVHVIIPVRNGARFVEACLDSVKTQTLQPHAVIVVDDGSSDDTPGILARYVRNWSKLRLIRTDPAGVSHARNIGIAAAKAPFVAFLDSDDVWWPEKLERQMSLLLSGPADLGLVHCAVIEIDEFGKPLAGGKIHSPSKRGHLLPTMVSEFYHLLGSASAVVARRYLVMQAGGFDESLTCGEDQDLWLKLAHVSLVDYVPDVLAALRLHSQNSCSNAVLINPELVLFQRLKIWSKWIGHISDRSGVIKQFRNEAIAVHVANVMKRSPVFGLYRRLKRSELELAPQLFKSRLTFFSIRRELFWRTSASRASSRGT